jgi:hypothetical protein
MPRDHRAGEQARQQKVDAHESADAMPLQIQSSS